MPSSYNIGPHYETLVRSLVESGRYASASEVLRDGLRLLEERDAKLRALRDEIRKGLDSGPAIPAEVVLDRLQKKYLGRG